MKYIKRILAFPFILGLMLITHLWFAVKRSFHFVMWGGEFIQYPKDETKTIQSIYEQLRKDYESKNS